MASACINNVGVSPENFLDCSPTKYKSYGWLSPRISTAVDNPEVILDPEVSVNEMVDFEFRLEDPVNMLPADELFSDGKLMPLQLPTVRPAAVSTSAGVRSPETPKLRMRNNEISRKDPYLFSPKAPRCSSRWREILGLKKFQNDKHEAPKNCSNAHKSLKNFLNRSSKSSTDDSSLHLPLLNKDSDNESISISSSRLSLSSSSSSGHEHDDLPRLSLDFDKPCTQTSHNNQNSNPNPPRIRLVKHRALSSENPIPTRLAGSPVNRQPTDCTTTSTLRGLSVDDSPRMNSSGKIVFHNLGRSSSSPSSFNGGPRYKHGGGVERSYSANVRVTTVLNVPVCSSLRGSSKSGVFGFPLFSSGALNKKHHSSSNTATGQTERNRSNQRMK
ncbi:uncharacterized protein LOC125866178 isoform X1 [Solanum stenotomum]|uniref:uncharacterized protein LOC125866178 isoform X1 n=2 Tax=Solanum stenotomum TaxID=172797 RepID=UPI0020D0D212|nr:uncharacterized protein LOC125866178 isoform X1 [Solanum stenotomum]